MTDPHRDGHERFRVTKENFGVSNDTLKIVLERLNELQEWDTTLCDGLDELEYEEEYEDDES